MSWEILDPSFRVFFFHLVGPRCLEGRRVRDALTRRRRTGRAAVAGVGPGSPCHASLCPLGHPACPGSGALGLDVTQARHVLPEWAAEAGVALAKRPQRVRRLSRSPSEPQLSCLQNRALLFLSNYRRDSFWYIYRVVPPDLRHNLILEHFRHPREKPLLSLLSIPHTPVLAATKPRSVSTDLPVAHTSRSRSHLVCGLS